MFNPFYSLHVSGITNTWWWCKVPQKSALIKLKFTIDVFSIHRSDLIYTVTDYMYGPLRFTRTDLVAETIQRGRDFGLRSYNEMRKALDLQPVKTFEDINPELSRTNPQVKPRVSLAKNDQT